MMQGVVRLEARRSTGEVTETELVVQQAMGDALCRAEWGRCKGKQMTPELQL